MNFAARSLTPDTKVPRTAWTPDKVQQLKVLWLNESLTGAEIASLLGFPTKNSVIGKANRLGLRPRLDKMKAMRRRIRSAAEREARALLKASRPPVSAPTAPEPEPSGPESLGLKIWELRESQCRYIEGFPHVTSAWALTYCGHAVEPGSAWCPYHKKLCTEPPTSRQLQRFRADAKQAIKNG